MLRSVIRDPGSDEGAAVTNEALHVHNLTYPPFGRQGNEILRQYLTLDGTSSGDNDMGVNGAVTNQEFYIGAASKVDRYIARLDFTITYGTSGGGWEWADANAVLSNGIRIYYQSQRGDIDIHEGITNNQDFLRLRKEPLPNNWEVRHLGAANDYGYTVVIDFVAIGFPHGIKLDRGSAQKLAVTIRDDVSDADVFNGIAMGTSRFEL